MDTQNINYSFIAKQLNHWLSCPTNGYLGSDYGIDLKQYLQRPMSTFDADALIVKMKNDIPILNTLPENSINIFIENNELDGKSIIFQIADKYFQAA